MIFAGDVAHAREDTFSFVGFEGLKTKPWCFNLEGAILPEESSIPDWGTYNSNCWLRSFSGFNLGPVFLANNHIHDLPEGVQHTRQWLEANDLDCFGAGRNYDEASKAVTVESGGDYYTLVGFGWPVIGCRPADKSFPGVNRFEGHQVVAQVREVLKSPNPGHVVVVIHGNYEFERYPQPGHRKLARQLIDEGVYAVICHHPHIVSPVERYKGRTIAYSLGNWAFSYGRFFGQRLKFPMSSFQQIAVELNSMGDQVHHATFSPPEDINYKKSEFVNASDFSLKPVFEGFDDSEYLAWFKCNRIKKKALPVYVSSYDSLVNTAKDRWVSVRQKLIDKAVVLGLKKVRRS